MRPASVLTTNYVTCMSQSVNIMHPDRRSHLIGCAIREIATLEEQLQAKGLHPQEVAELNRQLQVAHDKLRHLRLLELDFLQRRAQILNEQYHKCSPGEMQEFHALLGEVETKIQIIKKEVGRG